MRGTRGMILKPCQSPRIIPADAGNTDNKLHAEREQQDHPRGCGEHTATTRCERGPHGSSPRMRGTHELENLNASITRIIPADAGNTLGVRLGYYGTEDHPRGCGEHTH